MLEHIQIKAKKKRKISQWLGKTKQSRQSFVVNVFACWGPEQKMEKQDETSLTGLFQLGLLAKGVHAAAAGIAVSRWKRLFGRPEIHVASSLSAPASPSPALCIKLTFSPPTVFSSLAELPYGWEKIDDPIYGSYYVE